MNLIKVGIGTYGPIHAIMYRGNIAKLIIGNYCSIAGGVRFLLGGEHNYSHISTFPFKEKILKSGSDALTKGDITIDDDVWIGSDVLILSGVKIHQGAVIAAGAVVVSDVEPYSIVGGVPAKHIKFRFNEETIKKLCTLDFSKLDKETIQKHSYELYEDLEHGNGLILDNILKWFPKKK